MNFSKGLIIIGIILLVVGLLSFYFPSILNWPKQIFGNLPLDFKYESKKGDVKVFIPIGTSILLSILLTLLLALFRR